MLSSWVAFPGDEIRRVPVVLLKDSLKELTCTLGVWLCRWCVNLYGCMFKMCILVGAYDLGFEPSQRASSSGDNVNTDKAVLDG